MEEITREEIVPEETVTEEISHSEHRAIVFKMNRKQAAAVARYIKDHSGSPETIFAVDVDTLELIVQAKNAGENDILVLEGEEDVFDVEEEVVEENEEVWEAIEDALEGFAAKADEIVDQVEDKAKELMGEAAVKAEALADKVEAKVSEIADKVEDMLDGDKQ